MTDEAPVHVPLPELQEVEIEPRELDEAALEIVTSITLGQTTAHKIIERTNTRRTPGKALH